MHFRTILAASAAVLHQRRRGAGRAGGRAGRRQHHLDRRHQQQEGRAKTWKIQGLTGKVLGIDVRPADGMLYAVGADGGIYTVDLQTGKATHEVEARQRCSPTGP